MCASERASKRVCVCERVCVCPCTCFFVCRLYNVVLGGVGAEYFLMLLILVHHQ